MNKPKTALILGCSHAAGSEISDGPNVYLGEYSKTTYGIYHSYPAVLAQLLGYTPINHAIPGGSNDAMFRIGESFTNPYSKQSRPDLVIACWTGNDRAEIWDCENTCWQGLAPGKKTFYQVVDSDELPEGEYISTPVPNQRELLDYHKQWVIWNSNHWAGHLNKIKNVLALNLMCEHEKIPVINFDSFAPVHEFCWPNNVYRPLDNDAFDTWSNKRKFDKTVAGHFFADAHKSYAEYAFNKIKCLCGGIGRHATLRSLCE